MRIIFLKQARKELEHCPADLITDALAYIDDLASGIMLSMPVSRPLPRVAKGLHELRISERSGEYRIFYVIKVGDAIYILHVAHKKTQKMDARTIYLVKNRLKEIES